MAPELNEVLSQSVKVIIYIKNSALNTRLVKALCDEMGSDHRNILAHSEVHWLSRVNFSRGYMNSERKLSFF